MKLDESIAAMLKAAAEAGIPAIADLDVPTARQFYRTVAASRQQQGGVAQMASVEDTMIPSAKSQRPVRIYKPQVTQPGPVPIVLFLHGGGWMMGDLDTHDAMARNLAQLAGANVISLDYRLAPEAPFPAGVEDALASCRWIKANKDQFGSANSPFGIAGDSAGGNFAAVVSAETRGDAVPIDAQFLIYPATDMRGDYESRRTNAEGYMLDARSIAHFMDKYVDDLVDLADPWLSPLCGESLAGLPPTLVYTAAFDPLCDEGEAYGAAVNAAGGQAEVVRCEGMIHGFFDLGNASPAAKSYIEQGCTRFGEMLRG